MEDVTEFGTMTYDREKYRDKREKVLGVRKRGVSFATLAAGVSIAILVGLGLVVVPRSIAYYHTRHLEDAIYRLPAAGKFNQTVLTELQGLEGVRKAVLNGARLVVTFDKSATDPARLAAFFKARNHETVLLNHLGHRERREILAKERRFEADEAP